MRQIFVQYGVASLALRTYWPEVNAQNCIKYINIWGQILVAAILFLYHFVSTEGSWKAKANHQQGTELVLGNIPAYFYTNDLALATPSLSLSKYGEQGKT